jgi:hypothetical protein
MNSTLRFGFTVFLTDKAEGAQEDAQTFDKRSASIVLLALQYLCS